MICVCEIDGVIACLCLFMLEQVMKKCLICNSEFVIGFQGTTLMLNLVMVKEIHFSSRHAEEPWKTEATERKAERKGCRIFFRYTDFNHIREYILSDGVSLSEYVCLQNTEDIFFVIEI